MEARWLLLALCATTFSLSAHSQHGNIQHVHDPVIAKDRGSYWVFSTGGTINVRNSSNLVDWKFTGQALGELPAWAKQHVPLAKDLWAPDISFFNNRFHLYYSVSTFGSNRSCIGLATNKTLDPNAPGYRWEDKGMVVSSNQQDNFNAIDSNVVIDEKNTPWLSFGSFHSGIKLVRLNPNTGKPSGKLIDIASRNGGAIEAPYIIRHGGLYYLFVSFDSCCKGAQSDYKIMIGRAKNIEGPYLAQDGKRMLDGGGTLVLASYANIRGPGHNSYISTPEGKFMAHHYYDALSNGIPKLNIRKIFWDEKGWPVVGEPVTDITQKSFSGQDRKNITGSWTHYVNEENGAPIEFKSDGKIGNGPASWALKENHLELKWPKNDGTKGLWVDKCFVGPEGNWYSGKNQQGALIRGIKK